mmetsp:Transcript_24586/g.68431  ORF Transcript_24586/g.68431 Transcript_24586/m.68431 type:complete len:157 (+) Transcript_24586:102-572(+)
MSRDMCPVCMVDAGFSMVGGMLHCNACGSLMPDFVEEVQEYDDTQMTKSRAHGSTEDSALQAKPQKALHDYNRCAKAYAQCLQALLKSQIHWLVHSGKVAGSLDPVVHSLWRSYVLRSGLLELREASLPRGTAASNETQAEVAGDDLKPGTAVSLI